jgi:hypothetical protein
MPSRLGFTVTDVSWRYTPSREIGSDEEVCTGISEMDVTCNDCGHHWTARRYGDGAFTPAIGNTLLTCPDCGQDGHVKNSDLPAR